MYLGFDFYRDDSIKDLDERLARINQFLSDDASFHTLHRRFGVFLLFPLKKSPNDMSFTAYLAKKHSETDLRSELLENISKELSFATYLNEKCSKTNYRLCLEFFKDDKTCIPELELLYDLGETPDLYNSMGNEVKFVSFLCAYPDHSKVMFRKSDSSISILFTFEDEDEIIPIIKQHKQVLLSKKKNRKKKNRKRKNRKLPIIKQDT